MLWCDCFCRCFSLYTRLELSKSKPGWVTQTPASRIPALMKEILLLSLPIKPHKSNNIVSISLYKNEARLVCGLGSRFRAISIRVVCSVVLCFSVDATINSPNNIIPFLRSYELPNFNSSNYTHFVKLLTIATRKINLVILLLIALK